MAKYYVNERGRFGGVTGTIIPFSQKMPDENDPSSGNWRKYLPAGFLRCDGSVYKSSVYPVLAQVLGTGDDSKFKKADTELGDDEFQLPDLGSKYISGAAGSGTLLNAKVTNEASPTKPYRVGAEIEVVSLVGSSKTISYEGFFEVVSLTQPIPFIGTPQFKTTTSDSRTLKAFTGEQAFQAHGHTASVGVFSYLGNWTDSIFVGNEGAAIGDNAGQNEGSNNLVGIQQPTESSAVVTHAHLINFPSTTQIKEQNDLKYNLEEPAGGKIEIDPFGLESTVTITTEKLYKLDEATPPYILVEYLIKI